MRLLRIDIEQFRSIGNQRIPADGLVVLFGANSAGKTSVLEAAEHLITQATTFRPDPGAEEEPYVLGSVMFALPAASVADSQDARLYLALLRGEYSKPSIIDESPQYPWGWLAAERRAFLEQADLDHAIKMLTDALARAGDAGSVEDRALLSRAVFDPGAIFFVGDLTSVSLQVYGHHLPADAMNAASRIAEEAGGDALWKLASALTSDGSAHVGWVATGSFRWEDFAAVFPPVIVLDGDIESLSAEIERAVSVVHDRLWHVEQEVLSSDSWGEMVTGPTFDISNREKGSQYQPDPWLETRTDDGGAVIPDYFDPYDQGDWFRVRRSVLAAAQLIEMEANEVAPNFVKSTGRIGVEVLPVSIWGSGKVRATFTETGDEKRDLRVVGAGTGRWVAAAIRLAARRLSKGRQIVVDGKGVVVQDQDQRRKLIVNAFGKPLEQANVRLEPSDAPAVYIADEPEAHLHPAALRSVAAWLGDLARTAAAVIVATHSTALLDCQTEVIHRVHVRRATQGTKLQLMTRNLADELSKVSQEFGLTKGELLLLTRLALFVEGQHDEIILHEWFGEPLRTAGIRVFPVRGVDNLPGLATSEVIVELGIKIATLSDETSILEVNAGRARTRGEYAVTALMAEARRAGIEFYPIGLDQPDILYYLDEAICRQHAPQFPGWGIAFDEWANAGRDGPWKRWVKDRYGLPITLNGIRNLAQECRAQGRIPDELVRKVLGLIAYASSGRALPAQQP